MASGNPFKTINTGDEDVFDAPVLEFGHNLEPELRTFGLGSPHTKDFLDAVQIDANGQINGLIDDTSIRDGL